MPFVSRAFVVLGLVGALAAQEQRALNHDDYDQWQSLRGTTYTQDGAWVAYQIEPAWGDGELVVREAVGTREYREPRGTGAHFSVDGRYVVFTIAPSKVAERDKKIADLRKQAKAKANGESEAKPEPGGAERPAEAGSEPARRGPGGGRRGFGGGGGPRGGPGAAGAAPGGAEGDAARERGELAILDLQTGKVEKLGKVKRSEVSDDVPVLLYQPEPKPAKPTNESKAETPEGGEPKAGEPKAGEPTAGEPTAGEPAAGEPTAGEPATGEPAAAPPRRGEGRPARPPVDPLEKKRDEGSELVVRDLATGQERRIADVAAFGTSRQGKWLWYHTSQKKPAATAHYGLFVAPLAGGEATCLLDGIAHIGNVTWTRDESALAFTSDKEDFAADKPAQDLYLWDGGSAPARRIAFAGAAGLGNLRVAGGLGFCRDGSVLDFDVNNPPEADPLPILAEDKVNLDIWNWRDGQLQSAQQKRGNGERNPSRTAVYHRDTGRLIVLGDERMRQLRFVGPDGARMVGTDDTAYERETTWDGRYVDVWLVNTVDGSRTRVLEKLRGNVSNAPGGRYLLWFGADYHWWSYDVTSGERRDLTGNLPVAFHQEDDDHPEPDSPHGLGGWLADDAAVLVYDEFDVWQVAPATGAAVCVTDGFGRATRTVLRRQALPRSDEDDPYVDADLWLTAVDRETLAEGLYRDVLGRVQKPVCVYRADKNIAGLTRPRRSERFFFTLSTFTESPDLWTTDATFAEPRRLSALNPQQAQFRWGKAELVEWIDADGQRDRGILIKPDGFDPTKKYPMMVYFYERMTQGLHNYVAPAAGTSPNASYYVSNGYLWFMPDVHYEVGYPGNSCVKCVVSGVQSLIARGFVDEHAIGAAGHSWGGYQTAFLVTRTNIFKAVESGAPVSDMLSAYGGIRYETGVSRQFQYEQTQSRIGGTPWQYPMRYWENSPIHFADKVQTPVLILHNDNDGAVPWTQGIEYFTALRRLGKECYLFNYNGEPHGLRQRQNMKDWTRRMSEYFAHHLRGAPAPKWMTDGVPYHERDQEKLPFAQSYIDAYVRPAPEPPAAPAKPAEAVPAAAAPTAAAPVEGASASAAAGTGADATANADNRPRRDRRRRDDGAQAAAAKLPQRGAPAPDFAVVDHDGARRTLAEFRGRPLLVWFYPKAGTPGCTAEGCGLRDATAEFAARGVAIVGVSVDDQSANAAFAKANALPFPLLCDTDRAMAIAYGAADDAKAPVARRIAVLVDGDGKVVQVWPRVDPRTFATAALAALPL